MESQIKQKMILVPLVLTFIGFIAGLVIALIIDNVLFSITQTISSNTSSVKLPILFYFLLPFIIALPGLIKLTENFFLVLSWKQGTSPACPNCGFPMKQKQAKKGQYTGQLFWGCCRYPSCKGKIHIG